MDTKKTIEDRIKTIKNEVSELHPLLKEIFSRHEGISRYEYTHGPHEMGADFIVVWEHKILRTCEYIGVIAKVGKIHQDLAEIDRQIRECLTVPRFVQNGKKRVNLTEVWVVASGSITGGAQRKINATHEGSKIHFVDGAQLADLVLKLVPEYWSDLPVEVTGHLAQILAEVRDADARRDLVHVDGASFYVEQEIVRVPIDRYQPNAKARRRITKVELTSELDGENLLLVEAGMGGGKSKLLRRLVETLADPAAFADRPWLPIRATYSELQNNHGGSLRQLLEAAVPQDVRSKLPDDARFVFLIDALDEREESQEELCASIQAMIDEIADLPMSRALLTSRPIGSLRFDEAFETTVARYEIKDLDLGKIASYLEKICTQLNLTTRILDDLRRSPLYAKLPQSPLAAVLLGQLLRENPQDLPSTMPELYSKYLELAMGRWDKEKGLQSQQEYESISTVLMRLAEYMLENELEAIATSEFRDRIRSYLNERNLNVDTETVFSKSVERSDVLVTSRDGHLVMFKHRSFSEFLYAKQLAIQGQLSPDTRAFELYWGNVYFFGCGVLKDSPALLSALAKLPPEIEQHRWLKPIHMADFALAAYATPYSVIEEAVYLSIVEFARLFCEIAEGRFESFFSQLPRMDLLCLVQLMTRDHYGFAFLTSALEYAAARVIDEPHTEVTPYALFLLSVAYVDATGTKSFDYLLDDYDHPLPLDLALGVDIEARLTKARSKLLKRHQQRLKRKLRDNPALRKQADSLFDQPLSALLPASQEGNEKT